MKICIDMDYVPPARDSMGGQRFIEGLAKALSQQHQIFFHWGKDVKSPFVDIPEIIAVDSIEECLSIVDLIHFQGWEPNDYRKFNKPWLTTIHGANLHQEQQHPLIKTNVVAVSKFAADCIGAESFVWASSDPNDFIPCFEKEDYFLWCAGTDWSDGKGLFSTIQLAKKLKFKLKIGGTGKNQSIIEMVKSLCDDKIEYLGAINGQQKAELFSKAKAFILLTKLNDACPLTMSEAMLSGTPIIGSVNGSLPEVLNDKVAILCKNDTDFAKAILTIDKKINPKDCYNYGLQNLSSAIAAQKYTKIYDNLLTYGSV